MCVRKDIVKPLSACSLAYCDGNLAVAIALTTGGLIIEGTTPRKKGNETTRGYLIDAAAGTYQCTITGTSVNAGLHPDATERHLLVVTGDRDALRAYVDGGGRPASASGVTVSTDNSNPLDLVGTPTADTPLVDLDDVTIYGGALCPLEIDELARRLL